MNLVSCYSYLNKQREQQQQLRELPETQEMETARCHRHRTSSSALLNQQNDSLPDR